MENETLLTLLTESEIRERMATIADRYPKERTALRNAREALSTVEAKALLAVTFMEPDALTSKNAKEALQKAIEKSTKLLAADKDAIVILETEERKIAYDLAKFDCETSDREFEKLSALLIYEQSAKKFTGHIERG